MAKKPKNAKKPKTTGSAILQSLLDHKTKIYRLFYREQYQRYTWIEIEESKPTERDLKLIEYIKFSARGREKATYLFGLSLIVGEQQLKLLQPGIEPFEIAKILSRFWDKTPKTRSKIHAQVFKVFSMPKLTPTQAMKELLARGYVHIGDFKKTHNPSLFSLVPIGIPLTWPFQFEQQQDGLKFLTHSGIPGYMGCPSMEQGQLTFLNRYY